MVRMTPRMLVAVLMLALTCSAALAAAPPDEAAFDATKMESYRQKNEK